MHSELYIYSANTRKQQSEGRYVAPLRHIIFILSQPDFTIAPLSCVLTEETTNTNVITFGSDYSTLKGCTQTITPPM